MKRILIDVILFALALALLTACKGAASQQDGGPTPTPLPTSTAKDYPVIASPACKLNELEALRTTQPQGDLVDWSPDGKLLAYVGPAISSNWFSGQLYWTTLPDFMPGKKLTQDAMVFGDLNWSPDGSQMAFLAFRQPDTYTVMLVPASGAAAVDLFLVENARTDNWSGAKAIVGWSSNSNLRVLTSCGEDCDQTLVIDTVSSAITPVGEKLRKSKDRLRPMVPIKTFEPTTFPPAMSKPNWLTRTSPQMKVPAWTQDGKKVAYIDNAIFAWVLLLDQKLQYMLDTPFIDVQEIKWSPDGRYIAVRTDDQVVVFDTECK
jgi:dipeptidyl aminopeptidase/acylaminoacyl peptidase